MDKMGEKVVLLTNRLVIRRFVPDDWEDLFEYLSQEETVKYEPYNIFSEDQSKKQALFFSTNNDFWAVSLKENNKVIGNIYLAENDFDTWMLGYVFNKKFHQKGFATEATIALVDDVFRNKNAYRVVANCNPLNTASWKLMEKIGMRREGHLIKNIYFKKDEKDQPIWADTYEYAVLSSEWMNASNM